MERPVCEVLRQLRPLAHRARGRSCSLVMCSARDIADTTDARDIALIDALDSRWRDRIVRYFSGWRHVGQIIT